MQDNCSFSEMGVIVRNCTDKKKTGGGRKEGKKIAIYVREEGKCEKDGLHCFMPLFVKKIQTTNKILTKPLKYIHKLISS